MNHRHHFIYLAAFAAFLISALSPPLTAADKAKQTKKAEKSANDPYAKEGNLPPRIEKLTTEKEAEILKEVTVPEGFDVTVFAAPPAVNYPVFVAAAPDGTLYVSSDGNGSLGRDPKRGRIIRLRDLDNDGRADETKVFCEVDSPRGLVWDHDRLYLVHPPHLSEFIDADHDGVAEKQNILVKDIAFGFKDRPADHTTNGLSLGIDGWLYIAGGDFGFLKATGTDGRTLQHRGGGVIRVRPDGTGLEVYSTGTRNILEVAISPLMDMFARDNTNDGGGWDVRFHHFTGLDDHGYPRLFKNFPDECIAPIADYGGGSGCGAVYIDEPGFGKWNNAPFTADWGTSALYHHSLKPKGATFEETEKPQPFIKMPRPTDADVDAMSRVYCASWKGATFKWEGPNAGYIVCVKPKGWTLGRAGVPPAAPGILPGAPPGKVSSETPNTAGKMPALPVDPLPDFAKASDAELVKLLESTSHRRRLEAQRELVRRPSKVRKNVNAISALVSNESNLIEARAAAIYAISSGLDSPKNVLPSPGGLLRDYSKIASISRVSVRALGETRSLCDLKLLESKDAATRRDSVINVARFMTATGLSASVRDGNQREVMKVTPNSYATSLIKMAGDADAIIGHAVTLALAQIGSEAECLDVLAAKTPNTESLHCVLRALAMIHTPEVTTGLIERLGKATDPSLRRAILSALCRLHFKEGKWNGDSWGTRPDTRGPYYQPEAWSETPKIAAALKDVLSKATPEEATFLISEMSRNRIQSSDTLERIITLAAKNPKLIADAIAQMGSADNIPAAGIPLLIQAAGDNNASPAVLAQTIAALSKIDSKEGTSAMLQALVTLDQAKGAGKEQTAGRNAFLNAPKLENIHLTLEAEAEKISTPTAIWSEAALLTLAARKTGSPESREMSQKALDTGWKDTKRRLQIINAAAKIKSHALDDKILAAVDDPDKTVASAAKNAVQLLKLEKLEKNALLIGTMKPADVLAQVVKIKGDIELGEQLFTKQTCIACHTTSQDQPQKGPYLGNIAQTYKRPDLAANTLDPNKTIAQGFATNVFTLKDGSQNLGFVTNESGDKVTIRTITAQEFTYNKADITKRDTLPTSLMPPGLLHNLTIREFASLLDYLESLSAKK